MVLLGVRPYGDFNYNLGRETFLARVAWEDRWPVVNPGVGHVEFSASGPHLAAQPFPAKPARTDFDATGLGFEWNFLRSPRESFWSLTERPGWLRLKLRPATLADEANPSFIGRRVTDLTFSAATAMEFSPARDGESAGLVVEQNNNFHFRLECLRAHGTNWLRLTERHGGRDRILAEKPLAGSRLWLKISAGQPSTYDFAYATVEGEWVELKTGVDATTLSREVAGGFTGAYLGLYASGNGSASANIADFNWFEYRPGSRGDSRLDTCGTMRLALATAAGEFAHTVENAAPDAVSHETRTCQTSESLLDLGHEPRRAMPTF